MRHQNAKATPMADSNVTAPPILNPDTPLAFLEPEAAYQTAVSIYVTAASLGVRVFAKSSIDLELIITHRFMSQVLVWDIVDNISEEYKVVFRSRFNLSTLAYIGSRYALIILHSRPPYPYTPDRVGSLGYVLSSTIFTSES